jgi:hypothetical protein
MDEVVKYLPASMIAIFAPALALIALLWKGDDALSNEARVSFGEKLSSGSITSIKYTAIPALGCLLDLVYGERHFTLRCVKRVFVISILSAFVVFTLLTCLQGGYSLRAAIGNLIKHPNTIIALLVLSAFINFVSDYLSILKSRGIVYHISISPYKYITFIHSVYISEYS